MATQGRGAQGPQAKGGVQAEPPEREDFHAEEAIDKPFDRGLALRLLRYVQPYPGLICGSLALLAVTTGLSLLGPVLVKEAIDGPLASKHPPQSSVLLGWLLRPLGIDSAGAYGAGAQSVEQKWHWLLIVIGVYGVLLVVQFAGRFGQTVVMSALGQNVMRDLRMQIFRHVQKQSLGFFQGQPVGRLVTRVTSDVEALNELLSSGIVTFLGDILTLAGIVALLFYYNVELAELALSVFPFLLGVTFLFRAMARKHYREMRRRLAHLNAFTQESIAGMDVIQISRREDWQANRYRQISGTYLNTWLKSIFWYAFFFPSVEVLAAVSLALVVVRGGSEIMAGTTTFGEFFLFWTCLNRFFVPIRDLAEKYNILQAAMAAGERVFGVLDEDTATPEGEDLVAVRPLQETIRFENVWFAYDPGAYVLRSVSFEVHEGETVALVGATGAGKSTVVNLLLRFYDPTRGRILIDGVDIRQYPLGDHRRRFGLVLQDVSVFSRSVEDNIDLDRSIAPPELERAAKDVHADGFIRRLRRGYQETMTERGRTLSGGERQLMSFARALAGRPEILVLDEATSHIDTGTEALIQDALTRLVRQRTSIVIAHRLSTIRNADRILVFHHGELREQGRHEELLSRGGIYARLYRLQFGLRGDREGGAA